MKTKATGSKLPSSKTRLAICEWINGQFETTSLQQLPQPPLLADCAVWTCPASSGLVGIAYLEGDTVFYSSSNGVNETGWWRIGDYPDEAKS